MPGCVYHEGEGQKAEENAENKGKQMKIRAEIPSVEKIEIDVPNGCRVSTLKEKICDEIGIEGELTKLILNGKILEESTKLNELKIDSKSTIIVDYFWARQFLLWGKLGQSKLRKSAVLVAGAGAIGNEVIKNLAMLGIGRIKIIDYDVVELSNISRMVFFEKKDVGRYKVDVVAEKLKERYPFTEITTYNDYLENIPVEDYFDVDVIICGLDNVLSRIILSNISRKYLIPMVDGGIIGYKARVQVYVPPDSPCPVCSFPQHDYAKLIGLTNPCDAPPEEAKTPSLPTTLSLVSSIQTQEAIKILLGYKDYLKSGEWSTFTLPNGEKRAVGEPLRGILIVDLQYSKYSILELNRNPNCIVCGKKGVAKETVPRYEISFEDLENSTTELKKKVIVCLGIKNRSIDRMLSKGIAGEQVLVQTKKKLSDYGIRPDRFVRVIFKQETGEYKEAIFRLL